MLLLRTYHVARENQAIAIFSYSPFVGRIAKQFQPKNWRCPPVCPSVNILANLVNLCVKVLE